MVVVVVVVETVVVASVVVVVVLLVGGIGVVGRVGHPVKDVVFLVGHPVAILTAGGGGVSPFGGSVVDGRVTREPPGFVGNTTPPGFLVVDTVPRAISASVELAGKEASEEDGSLKPGGRRFAGTSNLIGSTD